MRRSSGRNVMITLLLSLALSCGIYTRPALAQCLVEDAAVMDASEEPLAFFLSSDKYSDWFHAIRNAPRIDVFNVSGHILYEKDIIKADLVTFTLGSTLEFVNVDVPHWIIAARKLEFQDRNNAIKRNGDYTTPTPRPARSGNPGRNGRGHPNGRNGDHGRPGERGPQGQKGGSKNLPCLLIFAESVEFLEPNQDTIQIRLEGIDGGRGGNGGRGGKWGTWSQGTQRKQ